MNKEQMEITPDTKLAELFENFPDSEEIINSLSPDLKNLKNPGLKKSISETLSLRQTAQNAGESLNCFMYKLHERLGLKTGAEFYEKAKNNENIKIDPKKIIKSLDARPILEAGNHPLSIVLGDIEELKDGEIYEFITPFPPVPLLEKVGAMGYQTQSISESDNIIKNYIFR